jgi:mRNA interferase RelE/StbE
MTYTLIWSGEVIRALNRLRREEPDTAKILTGALLGVASDPRPTGSNRLGSTDLRRLRLGDHRILYEISEASVTVHVVSVGSVRR